MKDVLSLEQFAAIEAWMEAFLKFSSRLPGDNYADLITAVYRNRQRAMVLLTGAKFPAIDKEHEAEFKAELEAMLVRVRTSNTGRATPPKPIKLPREDDFSDIA